MHIAKRVNLTLYMDDDAHYRAYQWYMKQPAKQRSNFVANCINMASEVQDPDDNDMKAVQGMLQNILQQISNVAVVSREEVENLHCLDMEDDGIDDVNMDLLDMF